MVMTKKALDYYMSNLSFEAVAGMMTDEGIKEYNRLNEFIQELKENLNEINVILSYNKGKQNIKYDSKKKELSKKEIINWVYNTDFSLLQDQVPQITGNVDIGLEYEKNTEKVLLFHKRCKELLNIFINNFSDHYEKFRITRSMKGIALIVKDLESEFKKLKGLSFDGKMLSKSKKEEINNTVYNMAIYLIMVLVKFDM